MGWNRTMALRWGRKKKNRAYFNGAEIHLRVNTKHTVHAAVASIDVGESLGILLGYYFYFDECAGKITNFLSASEPSSQKELSLSCLILITCFH